MSHNPVACLKQARSSLSSAFGRKNPTDEGNTAIARMLSLVGSPSVNAHRTSYLAVVSKEAEYLAAQLRHAHEPDGESVDVLTSISQSIRDTCGLEHSDLRRRSLAAASGEPVDLTLFERAVGAALRSLEPLAGGAHADRAAYDLIHPRFETLRAISREGGTTRIDLDDLVAVADSIPENLGAEIELSTQNRASRFARLLHGRKILMSDAGHRGLEEAMDHYHTIRAALEDLVGRNNEETA